MADLTSKAFVWCW